MKRKTKLPEDHLFLKPVRLYLDDLEHIVQVLTGRGFEVKLADADYEYDTLEEIKQYRGTKINVLNIQGKKDRSWHDISVGFAKNTISLFRNASDENTLLVWHELKEFLKGKVYWHQRVLDTRIWGVLLLLSPSFIFYPMLFGISAASMKQLLWVIFPAILLPLLISFLWSQLFPGLYVDRRFRVLNFWQRNSDKVLLLILGAVVGGFVKWLFDLLVNS